MSNNLENDRAITTGKMYPIDLAPQKITIVKSISNTEVKMAHIIPGQAKPSGSSQVITHSNTGPVGLMRTASGAQIISSGVAAQGTQIVSQGSQLIGQNPQILTQSQLISSSHILSPCTQIISQGTQLSAQVSNPSNLSNTQTSATSTLSGTQVMNVGGQIVSGSGSLVVSSSVRPLGGPNVRVLPPLPHHNTRPVLTSVNVSTSSGVLVSKGVPSHVPRGLAAGASLAVRPVAASTQPTAGPGSGWSANSRGRGALVYGSRGLSRGAPPRQPSPAPSPSHTPPQSVQTPQSPHSAIVTLPSPTVLTSSVVISSTVRGPSTVGVVATARPKTPTPPPAPRPLPLLQRNYQPAKVVGVASVGVRGVGNSAPPQLYYEVPRAAHPHQHAPRPFGHGLPTQASAVNTVQTSADVRQTTAIIASTPVLPRPSILRKRDVEGSPSKNQPNTISTISTVGNIGNVSNLTSVNIASLGSNNTNNLSNIATLSSISNISNVVHVGNVNNLSNVSLNTVSLSNAIGRVSNISNLASIGSISNLGSLDSVGNMGVVTVNNINNISAVNNIGNSVSNVNSVVSNSVMGGNVSVHMGYVGSTGWEDVPGTQGPGSGSTTMSAASSPTPDVEPEPPRHTDVSPRKKPRKQLLTSEVRQCDYPTEEKVPTPPPPAPINPIPKRPSLSSQYVCGWRSTALHFTRPADVRRREPRARDIVAIATQKHVLVSAEGWKVHHLTAQMDDLVSLETDVSKQLEGVHLLLETSRAQNALKPLSHSLLELIKGNIQRSKIVCEGIQEAREDILRVFKHRNFVSDILTRQADKRCFRKHRSQS